MRVKMRRRYCSGIRLSKGEFVDQVWVCGMLILSTVEDRLQLGLWESTPRLRNRSAGHFVAPRDRCLRVRHHQLCRNGARRRALVLSGLVLRNAQLAGLPFFGTATERTGDEP